MTALVLVPALAAAWWAWHRGFRAALVFIALPALLLLPNHYELRVPGLPDATFSNYTLLVTAAALWLGADRKLLRFRALDLLVLAFGAAIVATEYANKDFAAARNAGGRFCLSGLAPYALGRAAAQRDGLLVGASAMLVLVGAAVGIAAPVEAATGTNLFDWPRLVWPEHGAFSAQLVRNGLTRAAGPFSQPICQGLFFVMILPLALWLRDTRIEARRFVWAGVAIALAAGLLLTQSRGPVLGAALAVAGTLAAWSRRRAWIFAAAAVLVVAAVPFIGDGVRSNWLVPRAEASTELQQTAAYRVDLLRNFADVVAERPLAGYGRNRIPVVDGQSSIDNQYLFLALTHGIPAALLFLATLLGPAAALVVRLVRTGRDDGIARLGWALAATLAAVAVVQASVYAGTQTEQLMFLVAGLSVGVVSRLSGPSQSAPRLVAS
jgi:O-antigen ligase